MLYRAAVLVFLVGVTDGVKVFCNATRPHGDVNVPQCFGPLGGAVEVQLFTPLSQGYIVTLKKNENFLFFRDIERTIQVENYSFDLSTGIFTVKDIKRTDDAEYSIEIYHENGRSIAVGICSLSVQAPVSSPLLSLECLASGEQRVSCSAEGDALRYGWSLDGNPLVDTHLLSGSGATSHMTLKLGWSGVIKCSVSNDVSISTASTTVSVCVGFIYVNCTSKGTSISQWVHRDNNTLCIETPEEPGNVNETGLIYVNCTSNGTSISQSTVHRDNNTLCIETPAQDVERIHIMINGFRVAIALLLTVALGVYCTRRKKTSKAPKDQTLTAGNTHVW
ncbi:hypothetical protein NHX12_011402 [Muraenolepis orangiensis]|uniref:Ig-like domain-containing protein n=1 Tax=Muraenolepis orangiensis TaxID=630683 RepID=A0A9Q0DHN2_9TELE|nr:hypothetical protein NHX12_011402 [Muraenolepis orangiensis]